MKNVFDRLISRLEDTAEERISEFQNMSIGSSKMEKQREKDQKKKKNGISKNCERTVKGES